MNNKQLHTILKAIGEDIVPDHIDLWPNIQHRIKTEASFPSQRSVVHRELRTQVTRFRFALISLSVLFSAVSFLSFTAPGKALAQSIIRFFQQSISDVLPAPTTVPPTWVAVDSEGNSNLTTDTDLSYLEELCFHETNSCSTKQIRQLIHVDFKDFSSLPKQFKFNKVSGDAASIDISYSEGDREGLLVLQQKLITGEIPSPLQKIGASGKVEHVTVGNVIGEYVEGVFNQTSPEDWMYWREDLNYQTLAWVEAGVLYRISYNGNTFGKSELISLAKQLSSDIDRTMSPVYSTETSPSPSEEYGLSIAEAEAELGYRIFIPEALPEIFHFQGIKVDAETGVVTSKYTINLYGQENSGNGLLIQQAQTGDSQDVPLIGFIEGTAEDREKYPVGTVVKEYTALSIGSYPGQYVEGTWAGTECCGWQWEATPYLKRLRWQTGEQSFELLYMGLPDQLSRDDLIRIATDLVQ